jgi:actin-related protein
VEANWQGAAEIASHSAFSRLSVSKAEWSEHGDRICHAKFIN